MLSIKCTLCNTLIDQDRFIRSTPKSQNFYDCPRCGKYSIHDLVFTQFNLEKNNETKAILSYWVRGNQNENDFPYLDPDLVTKILIDFRLPDFDEQINNLLKYLAENSSTGKEIEITLNDLIALIGSTDKESLLFIFDELNRLNYVKIIRPAIEKDTLMNKDVRIVKCMLTVDGWKNYKVLSAKYSTTKDFNFKKHQLSEDEKIWLSELLKYNFDKIDAKGVKVKIFDKLTKQFDPTKIDYRLIKENRLTLLGLWYVDPGNKLFKFTDQVIKELKNYIKANPKLTSIDSKSVVLSIFILERYVEIIFAFLFDLRFCTGGNHTEDGILFKSISFNSEPNAFDKFLSYNNIEETLENYYNQYSPSMANEIITSGHEQLNSVNSIIKIPNIWDEIYSEYGISKRVFGKKINFIQDKHKRKIIFRDVQDAYVLLKNSYPKPSIILAGGVIEELLRLYLLHKGHTPAQNTFDEYIKICEDKKLLKRAISRLSDSIRYFRNYVHLEKEIDTKTSLNKSAASGVVSSIFTIVNDF